MNASFSLPPISECKDISEKIDLYEQYVIEFDSLNFIINKIL